MGITPIELWGSALRESYTHVHLSHQNQSCGGYIISSHHNGLGACSMHSLSPTPMTEQGQYTLLEVAAAKGERKEETLNLP